MWSIHPLRSSAVAFVALSFALSAQPGCAATKAHAPAVVWSAWEPATFERAKAENRIILVHVEAVWCHWCHVMLDETYGDADVRAAIADGYLPVRVDSDQRPDVAERYRDWGWPATAVLTPDARPVFNLRGYQEADEFAATLRKTRNDFDAGRDIAPPSPTRPKAVVSLELDALRTQLATQLDSMYDDSEAGWGLRQKYPLHAPVEHAFLRAELRGETIWRERALATLTKELRLIDPVWGGMYQYSVPNDWEHPHFEKIVPVQAQAMESFALAAKEAQDPKWLADAERIRAYLAAFFIDEHGGFFTSQDADVGSHPEDGLPFTDGHKFYALDDAGRRAIGIPRIDRGVYADRNGMLIAALCALYDAGGPDEALAMALRAATAIDATHRDAARGGALRHAASGVDPVFHLSDQIEMGRGYLRLWSSTGDRAWLDRATAIARNVLPNFSVADGGFYSHTKDPAAVGVFAERRLPFTENSRAARFLLALHRATDDPAFRTSAEGTLRALAPRAVWTEEGRDVGDLLLAVEDAAIPTIHATVVGKLGDERTMSLLRAALALHGGGLVVERSDPGEKYPDTGTPSVYICTDRACSAPVTDPSALRGVFAAFVKSER